MYSSESLSAFSFQLIMFLSRPSLLPLLIFFFFPVSFNSMLYLSSLRCYDLFHVNSFFFLSQCLVLPSIFFALFCFSAFANETNSLENHCAPHVQYIIVIYLFIIHISYFMNCFNYYFVFALVWVFLLFILLMSIF